MDEKVARQTNMMGKVSDKLDSQGKPWGTQGAQDLVEGNGEKEGWGIWHLKKCVGSPRPEVGAFEALECPGRPRRKLAGNEDIRVRPPAGQSVPRGCVCVGGCVVEQLSGGLRTDHQKCSVWTAHGRGVSQGHVWPSGQESPFTTRDCTGPLSCKRRVSPWKLLGTCSQ